MNTYLIIACITISTFCFSQPTKEQIQQVEDAKKEVKRMDGKPFPSFELKTLDGNTYTKEELAGKLVVFNFWFSRCRPCIAEMPEMNEMVKEFIGEEVVFLAPTFDNSDVVDKFLAKRDFDYEIIPDVKEFCIELNIRSYPTHFVINREGIIEKVIIGYSMMTVKSLRKSIRKLLKSQ